MVAGSPRTRDGEVGRHALRPCRRGPVNLLPSVAFAVTSLWRDLHPLVARAGRTRINPAEPKFYGASSPLLAETKGCAGIVSRKPHSGFDFGQNACPMGRHHEARESSENQSPPFSDVPSLPHWSLRANARGAMSPWVVAPRVVHGGCCRSGEPPMSRANLVRSAAATPATKRGPASLQLLHRPSARRTSRESAHRSSAAHPNAG